jgi:hypothetical protein
VVTGDREGECEMVKDMREKESKKKESERESEREKGSGFRVKSKI